MLEPSYRPTFSVGNVIGEGGRVFRSNLLAFAVFAVIGVLPFGAMMFEYIDLLASAKVAGKSSEPPVLFLLWELAMIVASLVSFGAMVHATVTSLDGRPVRIGQSLGAGVKRFFPLLGVGIVFGLGTGLGFLLLIVPGILLTLAWYMAMPVAVVERRGVFGSLGRAASLSKGHRVTLLGVGIVYFLLAMGGYFGIALVAVIGGFLVGKTGGATGMFVVVAPIGAIYYVAISSLYAAFIAAAYHGLRMEKDGTSPEQLADVFA